MVSEYWTFAKSNARSGKTHNANKTLTSILMLTHALEKAFSLPSKRKSFGEKKASELLREISDYISSFGYDRHLEVPIALLLKYIDYHKLNGSISAKQQALESDLDKLLSHLGFDKVTFNKAGAITKSKEQMETLMHSDFPTLAMGRYSVRDFGEGSIPADALTTALTIASKSPSACNRQAYRVHIFKGKQKKNILDFQGGASSFSDAADVAILVTADLNRYYSREVHLGYVDASLYAMSLIYALTSQGIASIPLTMGIASRKLRQLKKDFGIPTNEMPVILLPAGNYKDSFSVSMSYRNSIEDFVSFHSEGR